MLVNIKTVKELIEYLSNLEQNVEIEVADQYGLDYIGSIKKENGKYVIY